MIAIKSNDCIDGKDNPGFSWHFVDAHEQFVGESPVAKSCVRALMVFARPALDSMDGGLAGSSSKKHYAHDPMTSRCTQNAHCLKLSSIVVTVAGAGPRGDSGDGGCGRGEARGAEWARGGP
jgi:hypothetical protein